MMISATMQKTHRIELSKTQPGEDFMSIKDFVKKFENEGKDFDKYAHNMFNYNIETLR